MTAGNDGGAGGEGELGPTMCFLYKDFESDLLMDEQMIALVVWSRWYVFELGAQRNLGSIQRKAMLAPFLTYLGTILPPLSWCMLENHLLCGRGRLTRITGIFTAGIAAS